MKMPTDVPLSVFKLHTDGEFLMRKRLITALLVEDDAQILRRVNWLVAGLFNRQVQTLQASNFKEAREIIKHGHFDIAIPIYSSL